MSEREIKTFEEFWDYYVGEHRKPATRILHFAGTTAAMGLFAGGLLTKRRWLLLAAPIAGYGPAWLSHFLIEKNKPATFKYPLWSLQADFVMWGKMIRGQMQAEVDRVLRQEEERARDAQEQERGQADGASDRASVQSEAMN